MIYFEYFIQLDTRFQTIYKIPIMRTIVNFIYKKVGKLAKKILEYNSTSIIVRARS